MQAQARAAAAAKAGPADGAAGALDRFAGHIVHSAPAMWRAVSAAALDALPPAALAASAALMLSPALLLSCRFSADVAAFSATSCPDASAPPPPSR